MTRSPRRIRATIALNLGFAILPIGVVLVTVPVFIDVLGLARYGILSLVWILAGYAGFLDLGIGRAVLQRVAATRAKPALVRRRVAWTALWSGLLVAALAFALVTALGEPLLAAFAGDTPLAAEIRAATPWIAAAIAVQMLSSTVASLLEGLERFVAVNLANLGAQVLAASLSLMAAIAIAPRLDVVVAATVLARTLPAVGLLVVAAITLQLRRPRAPAIAEAVRLLRFGGWISVSGVVSPILTSLDRLIIASMAGPAALAYYAVPFSLAGRLLMLPGAVTRTLLPRVASLTAATGSHALSVRALRAVAALMAPPCVIAILAVAPFLALWIDPGFAEVAGPVAAILLAGVFLNALGYVPYGELQAAGRPRAIALIHLIELAPFAVLLWAGLGTLGLLGAALAWALRAGVDAALLLAAAGYTTRELGPLVPGLALVTAASAAALCEPSLATRVLAAAVLGAASLAAGLRLSSDIRHAILDALRSLRGTRAERPALAASATGNGG